MGGNEREEIPRLTASGDVVKRWTCVCCTGGVTSNKSISVALCSDPVLTRLSRLCPRVLCVVDGLTHLLTRRVRLTS